MTSRRRLVTAGTALALVLGMAGCGGIPVDGAVRQGREVGVRGLPPLSVLFDGPPDGASQEDIVRGFLSASIVGSDTSAAKLYLTGEAARSWDPGRGVVVYPKGSKLDVRQTAPGTVRLASPVQGRIDVGGRYIEPADAAQSTLTQDVTLSQVGGQWRISRLPPDFGLWMSGFSFDQLYGAFGVAYLAAGSNDIVMDYRWFPIGNRTATAVANAVLDPVPAYLSGAVRTRFPPGSQLDVESVPVADGVASVPMPSTLTQAAPDELRGALAQMVASLLQIRSIDRVQFETNGKPVEVVGVGSGSSTVEDLGFVRPQTTLAGRILVRSGTDIVGTTPAAVDREGPQTRTASERTLRSLPATWTQLASSTDMTRLAGVDAAGSELRVWDGDAPDGVRVEGVGTRLTRPSFDKFGAAWVAGVDEQGVPRVWVVDPGTTTARVVATPWLTKGNDLDDVRVGSTGARLALLLTRGGRTRIEISGIVRRSPSLTAPTALAVPQRIGTSVVHASGLIWLDDRTVAVIGTTRTVSTPTPIAVSLSGTTAQLPPQKNVTDLATTGGVLGLFARVGERDLYVLEARKWERAGEAQDLIVPGT